MINMFIECTALELSKYGIRVNGLAMSAANTTFRYSNKGQGISKQ